ncbi:MAG: helix-turn-helix domain-containing protein [Actinomycetota bacterium]|nr:helix-turn-helix domain-containing protein [Actinomycetota bacterium]
MPAYAGYVNMSLSRSTTGWDRRREVQLERFELIALQLFADLGYRGVTIDDIADAAGVSARTLFRYFPTKEDFLLSYPRRTMAPVLARIAALAPAPDPFPVTWQLIRDRFLDEPPEMALLHLWRRAAAGAPEVHARVKGDHQHALLDALTTYGIRCLGTQPAEEVRARLTAGVIVGMELAMIEMLGRSTLSAEEIVAITERTLLAASRVALVGGADPVAAG